MQTYYGYVDWTTNQTDPLDRLRWIEYATGTSDARRTSWIFQSPTTVIQQQDQNALGDNLLKTTTFYDGFGRPIKTQTADPNGDIFTEQAYNGLGLLVSTTNPYRSGDTTYTTTYGYL